jgi:hypothetical protein
MSTAPDEKPGGKVLRHLVGLILFPVIGFVVAFFWLQVVTRILDIEQSGFGASAAIVAFPIYAIVFGLFIWFPIWILYNRKRGEMSSRTAVVSGLVTGLILVVVVAGFRSFGPAPGAQYFGWAILAITSIGGWSHNKILHP